MNDDVLVVIPDHERDELYRLIDELLGDGDVVKSSPPSILDLHRFDLNEYRDALYKRRYVGNVMMSMRDFDWMLTILSLLDKLPKRL